MEGTGWRWEGGHHMGICSAKSSIIGGCTGWTNLGGFARCISYSKQIKFTSARATTWPMCKWF
jgi:hypothetical protein